MKRRRLDELLKTDFGFQDKNEIFVMVTEGRVFIDGQKAISPAKPVNPSAKVEIRAGTEYVGRGAYKLEEAIKQFHIDARGKICADIGSATGGFTEILLKYGAKKVYAVDTAKGKLALKLREDPRVIVMEETDARDIDSLPEKINLAAIDVSLVSLRAILPAVKKFLGEKGEVVALFKPQYEVEDKFLRHGVVTDDSVRERSLETFIGWLEVNGWKVAGKIKSPIRGVKGNVEYLVFLRI